MTREGYQARLYAIEWHANLWRVYGTPQAHCEALLSHLQECLDADAYGVERPITDDPYIAAMEAYLDRLFATSDGPQSFS